MNRNLLIALLAAGLVGCTTQPTKPAASTENAPHVDAKELAKLPTKRPADAVAFGGHWYKVFDENVCWHTAKVACEQMGGHLVCIETKEEQAFIAKLADGRYLRLGASDEAREDTWVWVNGAKWEYTEWMSGQPNNYGGEENFLATYDGGDWVDVADEGSGFWMPKGFICEWEK
jgi:hypothetical protein